MGSARINTGPPAMVAVVGPRRGPSERVLSALANLDATVCLIQTMRQLRSVCRDQEPDLVVLELRELTAERLNAEVDLLRGAGIRVPIFVISNGILPGDHPVVISDVVDFATAQATAPEIMTRIARVLGQQRRPTDPGPGAEIPSQVIDGVRLDWRARRATFGKQSVKFTTSELRLLEVLLRNSGRLVSTGTLLRAARNDDRHRSDGLVAVYVFSLRVKLRRLGRDFWIENEVGSGYRLTTGSSTPSRRKSSGPRNGSTRRSA